MGKLSLNLVKNDSQASSILDLMRFLSALTVFLFHFYVPVPGYQAVMVFFVLSGYFISSSVLKAVVENRWSWSDYLFKRLTRLWIVLLPALFLTYILAKIQLGLFGEDLNPPNLKVSNYISWELFFGNLFFMQGILVKGPFGLNGPLWSLTYEFWYYILFPCIILIFCSSKKSKKLFYLLVSIAISIFVGQKIMEYFLIWSLGAIIPLIKPLNLEKAYLKFIITLFSTLIAIVSLHYEAGSSFFLDLRVGITFSFLIYLVVSFFNNNSSSIKNNIPKYLAGFSYTLYLTHYPLANFILTWRMSPLWPFEGNSLIIKVALAILVIIYAWIIALLTEKHTDRVRGIISKLIFRKNMNLLKNKSIPSNNVDSQPPMLG
ncbi:acyltransferase family protein [Bacillus aerolatus]|uniref:Acyltransferase family protein n=1 Tax=Bacillus aerolatus TaxID=2653354 RepID=A0A6I1FMC7_9BACI|nr:acyltransferase [Bacillus aerolatus]KAB7708179.1 acyltransferase family protein [Bacillus aerolatus]